jgi:twitching motility protein PilT
LLTSSAAKGTIRAGQFGHLANVIQSGGEEGMWSFDRYQRWIDQYREWVIPAKIAVPQEARAAAAPQPAANPSVPLARSPARYDTASAIEIESEDLEDLAELARQLEQRIP